MSTLTFLVGDGVLMSTVSLYLRQRWGDSVSLDGMAIGVASLAGLMLALRTVSGMVAGPLTGILSDRLRDRWWVVRGGIALGAVGFVLLALVAAVWAVPAGVIVVSVSAAARMTAAVLPDTIN